MRKPTYYVWKTKDMPENELWEKKEYWRRMGFRVVILREGEEKIEVMLKKLAEHLPCILCLILCRMIYWFL